MAAMKYLKELALYAKDQGCLRPEFQAAEDEEIVYYIERRAAEEADEEEPKPDDLIQIERKNEGD